MSNPVFVAKTSPWLVPLILLLNAFSIAVAFQWNNLVQLVIDQYTTDDRTLFTTIMYTIVLTILFVIIILWTTQFPQIEELLV